MHALILAAGFGTRMNELTKDTPKSLLSFGKTTLIENNIALLRNAGIKHIVINTHYLSEKIISHLEHYEDITFTKEEEILETGGGIINALAHLSDEFIVINADIVTNFDVSTLTLNGALAHLVLVDNPPHNPKGDFEYHGTKLTFSGIGLYNKKLFTHYPKGYIHLATIIKEHIEYITFTHYKNTWYDVGTKERLKTVQDLYHTLH